MCGGTAIWSPSHSAMIGLSPRVRGNLGTPNVASTLTRSIPACAGEPRIVFVASYLLPVYPRVCGGTSAIPSISGSGLGLSPRVRGNRTPTSRVALTNRSIPACAGEPRLQRRTQNSRRVYPRVCGGTNCDGRHFTILPGLSPRVRGNRDRKVIVVQGQGSIPACAGEPSERYQLS